MSKFDKGNRDEVLRALRKGPLRNNQVHDMFPRLTALGVHEVLDGLMKEGLIACTNGVWWLRGQRQQPRPRQRREPFVHPKQLKLV